MKQFTSLKTLGYSIIFSPTQDKTFGRRYVSIELNEPPLDNIYKNPYGLHDLTNSICDAIQRNRKPFINLARIYLDDDKLLLPFSDSELRLIKCIMSLKNVRPSALELAYYDKKDSFYIPSEFSRMIWSELNELSTPSEN